MRGELYGPAGGRRRGRQRCRLLVHRVQRRGGSLSVQVGGWGVSHVYPIGGRPTGGCEGTTRARVRGVHLEHFTTIGDAGGIPAGDVLVEALQVGEEVFHGSDVRDVPVGDGAVPGDGVSRVGVVLPDRRPQGALGREDVVHQATAVRWCRGAGCEERREEPLQHLQRASSRAMHPVRAHSCASAGA